MFTDIEFALIIFCDETILHNCPQYHLQYSLLGIKGAMPFFQLLDKLLKKSKQNINLL